MITIIQISRESSFHYYSNITKKNRCLNLHRKEEKETINFYLRNLLENGKRLETGKYKNDGQRVGRVRLVEASDWKREKSGQ